MFENDTEFQEHVLTRVEESGDGWFLYFGSLGTFATSEHCKVAPRVGETVRLYGNFFHVRGIATSEHVYRYETAAQFEVSQAAMRERLRQQSEARDAAFRASEKPPLATFETADPQGWAACVETNSTDSYSFECCRYAAAWASLMEMRMQADPAVPLGNIARECSREADTSGITGAMYGFAVAMLAKFWVYGDGLRRWHNLDTQVGTEGERANESGGTLNPAMLSVGA